MSNELEFSIRDVTEKEPRTFKKGSKYDKLLNAFLDGHSLAELSVSDIEDASYLRLQITKRIQKKGLPIKASVGNGKVYLERTQP